MRPIVLISCVKSKRSHRCKAGDMYTSPLFQKMMAYADRLKPKETFILSAKYGLLHPNDIIEPYERTLKEMKSSERLAWANRVIEQLRKHRDLSNDHFVFLAGAAYRQNLIPYLKHYSIPMKGLGLGKQLQWLGLQLQ
jgi:cytoplasmic iron level regulating protein YaaA (DUF328/UPF0246 family)